MTRSYAGLLEVKAWNTFEGKLGNNYIQMSLYLFDNGEIKGNYILTNTGAEIQLEGKTKANAIFLTELTNNKPTGTFKGNVFADTLDKFEGTWSDSSQKQSQTFFLRLQTITWGDYEHRYSDMFGTSNEVEEFMEKVKTAILTDNKEWIANHVHYPTRQVLDKGFTSINYKQQLIKYFDQVFTKQFKEKIKNAYTTNLFNKNGAVMLGSGEIWVGNTSNSTSEKYDFCIIAIN